MNFTRVSALLLSTGALLAGAAALAQGTLPQQSNPAGAVIQDQESPTVRAGAGPDRPLNPLFDIDRTIDYKELMRKFVQRLATDARSHNPNFVVLAANGLELLSKPDLLDPDNSPPATTYLQALDGVLLDAVYYGTPALNDASDAKIRDERLAALAPVRHRKQSLLALEYANTGAKIRDAYAKATKAGFVTFVAPAKGQDLTRLPGGRPFRENPDSINTLDKAKNFAVIGDSSQFGRQGEFVLRMAETNYDMLIVNVFHRRSEFLTRQTVRGLKQKKLGARRLVLANVDIGTAAAYRFFWQDDWKEGSPDWIDAPYPREPDRYFVEYWRPAWQDIFFGAEQSYVYGLIRDLGFDGIVLRGLDSHKYFEGTLDLY